MIHTGNRGNIETSPSCAVISKRVCSWQKTRTFRIFNSYQVKTCCTYWQQRFLKSSCHYLQCILYIYTYSFLLMSLIIYLRYLKTHGCLILVVSTWKKDGEYIICVSITYHVHNTQYNKVYAIQVSTTWILPIWAWWPILHCQRICHGKIYIVFLYILHSLELLQIEVKVILALLLKTFKFMLEEGYEFVRDTSIMLYPKNGVPCTLTLRENGEMTIKENNPKRTFSVC